MNNETDFLKIARSLDKLRSEVELAAKTVKIDHPNFVMNIHALEECSRLLDLARAALTN